MPSENQDTSILSNPRYPLVASPGTSVGLIFCAFLLLLLPEFVDSSSPNPSKANNTSKLKGPKMLHSKADIRIIFSDVDGTLVHYPEALDPTAETREENGIVRLPPSATGMQGVISSRTLKISQEIRNQGVKLVLVSGMRTSTLLKRLAFLPRADAYCSEAGGRIFYPSTNQDLHGKTPTFTVRPKYYDGAGPEDLEPFTIIEDMQWRQQMEHHDAAGTDGYAGEEIDVKSTIKSIPVDKRKGRLWDFARALSAKGFVLDTKGYSTCFRVNRKQQTHVTEEEFDLLLRGQALKCPPELGTSTNLGCIDFYPAASGKKNCCHYVANKLCANKPTSADILSSHAVCACDDDNDLEMAMAVQHAYIPGVSSASMASAIQSNPQQFTQTGKANGSDMQGTAATEKALLIILRQVSQQTDQS